MFVTGQAQRRGLKAARVGTRDENASAKVQVGAYAAKVNRQSAARIGDSTSNGLVINGSYEIDPADEQANALGREFFTTPDFPVSYSGRGTLKFVSPIRISRVDGDLNVNGDITSNATVITVENSLTLSDDALNAFTRGESSVIYVKNGGMITADIFYLWDDLGSAVGTNLAMLTGLPEMAPLEFTIASKNNPVLGNILSTEIGSIITASSGSFDEINYGIIFNEINYASGLGANTMAVSQFPASGYIQFTVTYKSAN